MNMASKTFEKGQASGTADVMLNPGQEKAEQGLSSTMAFAWSKVYPHEPPGVIDELLAPHPNLGRSSGPGCHWFTSRPDLHGGAGHRRERNRISAPPCLPPHPRRHHEASLRASPVSSHSLCLRTFG